MTKEIDKKFDNVKTLTWYPWVGKQYFSIEENNKLLIIGESHFLDEKEESIKKHQRKDFTQIVIKEMAIGKDYNETNIFQNFHKAIFSNNKFDSSIFWNLISFYNFIQYPLSSKKNRPSTKDYKDGWLNYLEVIQILKPKVCIFLGTTSANHLERAIKSTNYSTKRVKGIKKIGGAYAKSGILKSEDGEETKLIFIRHTSAYFKWNEWNKFLIDQLPKEIKWLVEQSKI